MLTKAVNDLYLMFSYIRVVLYYCATGDVVKFFIGDQTGMILVVHCTILLQAYTIVKLRLVYYTTSWSTIG